MRSVLIEQVYNDTAVNSQTVPAASVRSDLARLNSVAAKGWYWRFSASNFWLDDGTQMDCDARNRLLAECGLPRAY